jgi:hypothetical protein
VYLIQDESGGITPSWLLLLLAAACCDMMTYSGCNKFDRGPLLPWVWAETLGTKAEGRQKW